MSFTLTGALTGAAVTGFTTPGYTLTADLASDARSKQSVVTALSGTQAGVSIHSINAPFTVTVRRPPMWKTLSMAFLNGVTGQWSRVPYNDVLVLWRKAAQVATNQWYTNEARTIYHIAAGTETFDAPNIKALISAQCGFLSTNSSGVADTVTTGIV